MLRLDQKFTIENFEFWLVVAFLINCLNLNQNRTVCRYLSDYEIRKKQKKGLEAILIIIFWNFTKS